LRVRREKKFRRRRRLALLLVLLAVGLGVVLALWSWLDAQARAVVVISSVLDAPVLTPATEVVSGEPRFADETVAGNPALVVRPAGEGPWPAVFFANGTIPEGRKLPEARRLAEGLARAGYLVVVPDLPGLTEDRITPGSVAETADVARAIPGRPDAANDRVALVGISTGATLALLAAERRDVGERVSVVAGVAPYSDIRTVVNVATTGRYESGDGSFVRHEADPFLSYVVARSLVAALPSDDDRRALSAEIEGVGRENPNPLGGLRLRRTEDLGPASQDVLALLANRDPARFDGLYAALPKGVEKDLRSFSPLAGAGRIEVPVEVATGPQDKYFPASESRNLGGIAPDLRVTVTPAIDHAEPDLSPGDPAAIAELDAFMVRSLREARVAED
jgi:pimeloyl-ACP methyl ester carboxylesterase